jgi:hypothetical protein
MDWLEQELKQALERKEPRADFDTRVNDRVNALVRAKPRPRQVLAMPRWLAAAAVLLMMTGAGAGYRWHQGQVAKDQVMLAMRIAGGKLNRVQAQLAGVRQ